MKSHGLPTNFCVFLEHNPLDLLVSCGQLIYLESNFLSLARLYLCLAEALPNKKLLWSNIHQSVLAKTTNMRHTSL